MEAITFLALPAEIHVIIARYCGKKHLINLCLTSKWVNERCLPVLYRHVDMPLNAQYFNKEPSDFRNKQWNLVRTLLRHPEYGKHVRFLRTTLCIPSCFDGLHQRRVGLSDEDFWRAMQSLTHIQTVLLVFKQPNRTYRPVVPNSLFQSATSVRLVGEIHFDLARSILNAINPKMLKHLCLNFDPWPRAGYSWANGRPREAGETMALSAFSVLLTTLTGRCTALRTLILQRNINFTDNGFDWRMAEEEASYIDWASFIRSVHGTVEKFVFAQSASWPFRGGRGGQDWRLDATDERFARHILPAIVVSGPWPCITMMDIKGVKGLDSQSGKDALMMELRAVLGANTKILLDAGGRRRV